MSYEYAGSSFDTFTQALRALVSDQVIGEDLDRIESAEQAVDAYLDVVRTSHDPDGWMSFALIGTDEREYYDRDMLLQAAREWIAELKIRQRRRVIFDDGGGIMLQIGQYGHYYDFPDQAARDWDLSKEESTDDWDGDDPEVAAIEPTQEQIRNGGYLVCSDADIDELVRSMPDDEAWGENVRRFVVALREQRS